MTSLIENINNISLKDVEREILYRRLENKKEKICEYILKNYEGIDFNEEYK